MLRIIFILLFFHYSIFANAEIKKFDQIFLSSSSEIKLQLHQQLKSLYIQSVISDNQDDKKEILKRLIISSNSLGFDDKAYIEELKDEGVKDEEIKRLKNALNVIQDQKIKKIGTKQENISKKEDSKKEDSKKEELAILAVEKKINGVLLNLNGNIEQKDIKNFTLKGDNFRYVADFSGILKGAKQNFEFKDFDIIVSQFNPATIRIVLTSKKELKVKIELKEKILFMGIDENKKIEAKPNLEKNKKVSTTKKKEEPLYILKSLKEKNGISVKLDNELDYEDIKINSFKDGKTYRSIVSFKAILEGDRKKYDINKNQSITLVQYDKTTVRIVLSSLNDFKVNIDLDDDDLFVGFEKKASSKTSVKKITSKKQGKVIVIDPGHGGKDPGTLGDKGVREKDVVLSVALKLGNELKKRGYKIYYTRSTDKFINLRDRTSMANEKMADLFISIHANAAPNKQRAKTLQGIETFFLSPARSERSKKAAELENQSDFEEMNYFSKQTFLNFLNREKIVASNKLAIDVQKKILSNVRKKYKVVDGGVREAPFWVLVGAQMPAILIETGYISHPSERSRLTNKNFQELLAIGIANGIESYFYKNQ
ncbi:N-acetylmuramoyl-L-alanine amidase [Campylobacter peloridis]|uniref:N-acetylmuramoyl-L-alanine amidase n=1 Tax=Campylobacter peloridis TaxID=488546 RepID=A0ABX6TRE0_9BACT|nr:N-acetylmuramoyl-L-alanine amidase [Campylobacter peloridis]AJC84511.1 N-acetylmuramoyl-L-alanine amidase [Campylobacter peloridis LMG 23910]QOQ88583.1 N-acetylmuramoyl-L-alanine amidase [Campylobacter peloridis]